MSFWQDLRDSRTVERLVGDPPSKDPLAALEEIRARQGPRARTLAGIARLRSERGDVEGALAAAEEAAPGLGPAAGLLLRAEVLCDALRKKEARALLEKARTAEPRNIAAQGFLAVLGMEESLAAGRPPDLGALPTGALWSSVVLSRLLVLFESQLQARVAAGQATPELHAARTHLFRPRLDRERFRRFWFEGAAVPSPPVPPEGAAAPSPTVPPKGASWPAVRAALRSGDLSGAASLVAVLGESPGKGRSARARFDEVRILEMEIAFVEGRYPEVPRLHASWLKAGGEPHDAYPAALAGYALLVEKKPARAREVLAPPLETPGRKAELRHLASLVEFHEGSLPRAAALIRLAVMDDDISLVNLAREEAKFLGKSEVGGRKSEVDG